MEQENKYLNCLFYGGIFLFVLAVCWFLLSDVHNNGGTAYDVREQLDRVGEEQRNAKDALVNVERGLDNSARLVDEVSKRIDDAESRAEQVKDRLDDCTIVVADSERRIGESREIIQGIRERAVQDRK